MKQPLRLAAGALLRATGLYPLYALRRSSALRDDGWFRSFNEKAPMSLGGDPMIWMTYPAIDFIKNRVRSDMSVFEYGCGNGTLWWASRVREVKGCEHDFAWFERIKAMAPANVQLSHVDLEYGGSYSKAILGYRECFDVVVIDGRDRVNCALNSLLALKPSGVLIFDDSDRQQYATGFAFLLANGFKRIEFSGMGPGMTMKFETSVFYRPGNVFDI